MGWVKMVHQKVKRREREKRKAQRRGRGSATCLMLIYNSILSISVSWKTLWEDSSEKRKEV